MKKILVMLALSISFLAAINVQKASKEDLMCIKGIGAKKADTILKYRKSHKLKSVDDLLEIKGFGKLLVKNVKNDVKSVACGGKKSVKKSTSKKTSTKKSSKKSSTKKIESKKTSSKESSDKKDSTKKTESKKNLTKDSDKKSESEK